MNLGQLKQAVPEPLLLVTDPVAVQRWEAVWLDRTDGRHVAARPPVMTPSGFMDRLLDEPGNDPELAGVLSPVQADVLWRQIIGDSIPGSRLISTVSAARAAAEAWRLLHEWEVPWETLRPSGDDPDFAALLEWCQSFRSRLRRGGWTDRTEIWQRSGRQGFFALPRTIAVDAPVGLAPAVEKAFAVRAAGSRLHAVEVGPATVASQVQTPDPGSELLGAARWLARRLGTDGTRAYAVIVADARNRRSEIESVLGDLCAGLEADGASAATSLWFAGGSALADFAAPGAAINALELLLGRGHFAEFGSWLRSPFFGADDSGERGQRSVFEASLRQDLVIQWPLREALRRGGLYRRLRAAAPDAADRLRAALELADNAGRTNSPTRWVEVFERLLRALGWRPAAAGTTQEVVSAWDRALRTFAATSAVVGTLPADRALGEFRRIADGTSIRAPMPSAGVHVLERPEQLGPGYAGIWLTGFTDSAWPRPPRLNPLLPERLQRAWQLPGTSTVLAQQESRSLLERILASGDEVVVSAPAMIDDAPARPSRALRQAEPGLVPDAPMTGYISGRIGARGTTVPAESVSVLQSASIRGGTRLLELQARCPIRAFIEMRLRARPLERVERGVSRRHRGTILHRALELLYGDRAAGGPFEPLTLGDRIREAADGAIAESIPWTGAPWDIVGRIERERVERALRAMLDADAKRAPLDIVAVEKQIAIVVGGHTIGGRIDRIDRLGDGRELIIDYKSGQVPSASAWYAERLTAPQMPAYAAAWPEPLAGFLVAGVGDGKVDCRAAGNLAEDFPFRPRVAQGAEEWGTQIAQWREQVAMLLSEFLAGDVRVAAADPDLAAGEFAPLTRIYSPDAWADVAGEPSRD